MPNSRLFHFVTLLIALAGGALWRNGGERVIVLSPATLPPTAYPAKSEKYYLACVEYGSQGVAGLAAMRLLRMPINTESDLTRRVRARNSDVIGDILLLVLFKAEPQRYRGAVERLSRIEYVSAFGWVKTDDRFEGEHCDFYFDGPGEAALALVRQGYLSANSFGILLQFSRSYYPEDRRRAAAIFRRFDGIPPYDPSPQSRNAEMPALTRTQTSAIENWFSTHQNQLVWEASSDTYRLQP